MTHRVLVLIVILTFLMLPSVAAGATEGQSSSVYGWVGTIYAYSRPTYDDYFVRNDGELYGITGENASVERLLQQQRGSKVKIWGLLLKPAPDFNGRQIVVREVLDADVVPTTTPEPLLKPEARITASVANTRSGPSTSYPVVTQVHRGASYGIQGRNRDSSWWQICCLAGRSVWIYAPLVDAEGPLDSVPVSEALPPPTPTPAAETFADWKGEYYSNIALSGSPQVVRNDEVIDFNWADKGPAAGLPADNFSVRWSRASDFPAGDYRFYANADDGVKLWLDDWLLIDKWQDGPVSTTADFNDVGAGQHRVRVEYFEHLGNAAANVWWQRTDLYHSWQAEYYNDIYLQPPAVLVRGDSAIDFNWGLGSPGDGIPADNFSVRWTRNVYFDSGDYRFHVEGGDGTRVRLDGWLIIDNWLIDDRHSFEGRFDNLGVGHHLVEVDWYHRGGLAGVKVWWERVSHHGGPQPD